MSLLTQIEPDDAEGDVAEIYDLAHEMMGYIPNALKMHTVNPQGLKMLWDYMGSVMNHPSLSPELFTCIRMLVSINQHCEYCISMNENMLMNMSGYTAEQVVAIKEDPVNAPLDGKELALLKYVLEAVEDSLSVDEEDIDKLRRAGCTDVEIYDALKHGAHQVMGDILLNAFNVPIE